jgi:hypothetical protein
MSKGLLSTIIGGLEIVAGVVLGVLTFGGTLAMTIAGFIISAGAGMLFTGIGTMSGKGGAGGAGGVTAASRNPVSSWVNVYGRARAGGQIVFHGENSK